MEMPKFQSTEGERSIKLSMGCFKLITRSLALVGSLASSTSIGQPCWQVVVTLGYLPRRNSNFNTKGMAKADEIVFAIVASVADFLMVVRGGLLWS